MQLLLGLVSLPSSLLLFKFVHHSADFRMVGSMFCGLYGFDYRDIYELTDFWKGQYFDSELLFLEGGAWIAKETIQYLLQIDNLNHFLVLVFAKTLE